MLRVLALARLLALLSVALLLLLDRAVALFDPLLLGRDHVCQLSASFHQHGPGNLPIH